MRNISFMLTQEQFRNRTKTVTRRLRWKYLQPGDVLMGCEKCQGLGKGGQIVRMGAIKVLTVRRERLDCMITDRAYGLLEVRLEGFPGITPEEFIEFFCRHNKVRPDQVVTRIWYEYLQTDGGCHPPEGR